MKRRPASSWLGSGGPARTLLFLLLTAGVLGPATVRAQNPSEEEDPLRTAARERYLRGRELLQQGNAVDALQELAASYQLFPSWASLYGMAMCQEAMGRAAEATDLYRQVLHEGGDDVPATERVNIQAHIAELQAQLGVTPSTEGSVDVRSTPAGADVLLDGEPVGTAPLRVDATVGPHRVEGRLDGYEPATIWVDVAAGETAVAELVLVAAGGTGRGALVVRCDAPATVFVDERDVGTAPTAEIPVDAGERRVRVVDDSGRAWEDLVAVAAGQTMVVEVRLGSGPAGLDPLWFWLTAGTAGALAVGGAATGGYVLSLKDEYDDPATSAALGRRDRSGRPLRVATDALFGAAGALAIAAITLVFFTDFAGEGGADADVGPLVQPETGVAERALFQW